MRTDYQTTSGRLDFYTGQHFERINAIILTVASVLLTTCVAAQFVIAIFGGV